MSEDQKNGDYIEIWGLVGKACLHMSCQGDFEENIECIHCKGNARIAFAIQGDEEIIDLYPSEKGKHWFHDSMACAVYFCEDCMKPTAVADQY